MQIKNDTYEVELDLKKDYGTLYAEQFTDIKGQLQDKETMEEIHDILDNFTDEDVFIDCGAHVGLMTILLKKGTAYAVEPNPETYEKLLNNIRLNGEKKIFTMNCALYDEEISFGLNVGIPTGMTNIIKADQRKFDYELPKTLIGDNLFKDIKNIRLIKIDCECSTPKVLNGLKETIKREKPILIVENNYRQTAEIMEELNYQKVKNVENNTLWQSL